MIHRIKPPACGKRLENILKFQGEVLALACDASVNLPLDEQAIKNRFGEQAGKWLWGKLVSRRGGVEKKRSLCLHIETILRHVKGQVNPKAGQEILDVFCRDTSFQNHLADEKFKFSYRSLNLPPEVKEALDELLRSFYTEILVKEAGFPGSISGEAEKFNRRSFVDAFYEANADLAVCSACDGARPDSTLNEEDEEQVHADADHFLPKARYPFLSVHPENLVPLCLDCNRTFKGDYDPIDDPDNAPLVNLFHPYRSPAIDEIDVAMSRKNGIAPQIEIKEKTGAKSRRVNSIVNVFDLEVRWMGRLRFQIQNVIQYVFSTGKTLKELGVAVDEAALTKTLENAFTRDYETRLGKHINQVLQVSYVKYALSDKNELKTLLEYFTGQRLPPADQ